MENKPILVIAEVGINHSGSLDTAKKLISEAKNAGADCVKFQKRSLEKVYSKEELDKLRESPWGTTNRQQKEGLEFNADEYKEIDEYCKKVGIIWFASAWDLESQRFLQQYDCKYNKVASAMLGHIEFLKLVASEKKHTFISTGMHTVEEIQKVYNIFTDASCPFTLMHCNSQYPSPIENTNLKCIWTLQKEFNCAVGFSSHYVGIMASVMSVAFDVTAIEAHITLDRSMYGSDQAASLEPQEFRQMVEYIRTAEKLLGDGQKIVYSGELPIKQKLARTKDY